MTLRYDVIAASLPSLAYADLGFQFEWAAFVAANNSILLNNTGNFVNRIIKFVNAKLDAAVPDFSSSYTDETFDFPQWVREVNDLLKEYIEEMDRVRLRHGLEKAMAISACGNNLLQYRLDNASLAAHPERTRTVVGYGLNLCSLLASILSPFMPSTSASIVKQLNTDLQFIPDTFDPYFLKPGHKIGKAAYLFSRIDEKKIAEWKDKFGGTSESKAAEAEAQRKKQEDKERKKARKAAKRAEGAAAAEAAAATGASSSAEGAKTGEEKPHTAATEDTKELPIREKPVEK